MGFELGWICVRQNYGRLGIWRGEGLGDSYPSGHLHQSDCVYMEDDIAWGLSFPYIWQERIGLPVMGWKGFYRPYHYAESLSYGEDSLSVYSFPQSHRQIHLGYFVSSKSLRRTVSLPKRCPVKFSAIF